MTVYSKRGIEKEKIITQISNNYNLKNNDGFEIDFEDEVKPNTLIPILIDKPTNSIQQTYSKP